MKRLFVAIDPPAVVREALAALQVEARGFHWTAQENLHLTLKFIGDVDSVLQGEIERILSEVKTEPFILPVENVGYFPATGRPFVLWAGVGSGHPRLFGMQKDIEDRLFNIGIEPERRRYSPHITLARCNNASPEAVKLFAKKHREFSAPPFRVDSFALFSSNQTPTGTIYREEARWPLSDSPDSPSQFSGADA